jgi:hypothetical protein
LLSGIIRYRNGQIVISAAGRPENPVESGLCISTFHRETRYAAYWLEPAYILAFIPKLSVDIAVLDRTGMVVQVHANIGPESESKISVGINALMKAPIAIVARAAALTAIENGMVLFWQDLPMVPLEDKAANLWNSTLVKPSNAE